MNGRPSSGGYRRGANAKRSEATKQQHQTSNPRVGEKKDSGAPTGSGQTKTEDRSKNAKATASGTNRGAVERMDELDRKRHKLVQAVGGTPPRTRIGIASNAANTSRINSVIAMTARRIGRMSLVPPQVVATPNAITQQNSSAKSAPPRPPPAAPTAAQSSACGVARGRGHAVLGGQAVGGFQGINLIP